MILKEFLINKGYNTKQIEIIAKKIIYHHLTPELFVNRYNTVEDKLDKYGYSKEQIKRAFILKPSIVSSADCFDDKYMNIKEKFLTGDKKDIDIVANAFSYKVETLNKKYEFILSLGFSKEDIKKMAYYDPKCFTRSEKCYLNCISFFERIGISKKNILKIFVINAKNIFLNEHLLDDRYNNIINLGFTKKEATFLAEKIPPVLFDFNKSLSDVFDLYKGYNLRTTNIKDIILKNPKTILYRPKTYKDMTNYLYNVGYTKDEIKKIFVKAPNLLAYKSNAIELYYDFFINYGLNNDEIKQILLGNPKILYHSLDKINNIIKVIEKYDIDKINVVRIITNYPTIFESSIENVDEKLELLSKLDILEYALISPKNLIQGSEKTYLRYSYILNELNMEIDSDNYMLLYYSDSKSGVSNKNKTSMIPTIDTLRKYDSYSYYKDNTLEKRLEKGIYTKCYH